jgi:hypothetical protein
MLNPKLEDRNPKQSEDMKKNAQNGWRQRFEHFAAFDLGFVSGVASSSLKRT